MAISDQHKLVALGHIHVACGWLRLHPEDCKVGTKWEPCPRSPPPRRSPAPRARVAPPWMPSPPASELPALWQPHQSVLRPPNFYRSGQSAAEFNGSSILFFGGCAHGQCHNDLMVLRTPSFASHCLDVHCSRTWAHARAVDFSGAPGGPSPRQGALMAVLGRWAWLVGGSGGDLTIDAYKLDLAPRYAQKNSRPEVSAEWPFDFEMPRQRQIKLRAASSLG
jgi:hypothetical protein